MTWDGTGLDPWLPDRLAAEARITAAERALYTSWLASISRWLVKAKRGVYANGPNPDPTGVFSAAPDWAQEMDRFVHGPVKDTMGIAYRDLFGDGYRFDTRPAVVAHLAGVHNRMVRTTDDVFGLVAGEVARGATAGASMPDIADRVDEVLSATGTERWRSRAVTVARTEGVGSLNAGRHDSFEAVAEELGEPMEHMWISTIDSRTRSSHAGADQMRVPLGEPFNVGGADLRYPGDPLGPAEEVINCRCSELVLGVDEQPDLSDRQYTEDDWDEWNDSRDAAPPSPTEPVKPPPRDLETAARQRQARIDSARGAGGAAAELDEVAANLDGTLTAGGAKALEHRIAGQVARGNLPPDVADDLRAALRDGDLDRMSAVAWRHAEANGARRVGQAGDVVPFDRKLHRSIDGTPSNGQPVVVVRSGVRHVDEDVVIEKAVVGDADDVSKKTRAADADATSEMTAKAAKTPKLEIRPALRGGTPAKAGEKFAAEWKRITGRDITVDPPPKGASGATLREHYEGLLRAAERFPEVELERVGWWDNPAGEYAQAIARKGDGRSLEFGTSWLGTTARTQYLRSLLRDVQTRWSPRGFDSPGGVAMHEFGHMLHLHSRVDAKAVTTKVRAALRRHAKAGGYVDEKGKVVPSLAARQEVSGTAATSIDELVGDALADVLLNGPRASALSREVVDILEKAYGAGVKKAKAAAAAAARRAKLPADFPSARAPSLEKILDKAIADDLDDLDPATIGRWVDGDYAGLKVRVLEVKLDYPDAVRFYGDIRDADGNLAGDFERVIRRDRDSQLYVYHDSLILNAKFQGSGFQAAFNSNLLDWYKRSKVAYVKLVANIDVGGYAWARAGYDWANPDAAKGVFSRLGSQVEQTAGRSVSALRRLFHGASDDEISRQVQLAQEFHAGLRERKFGDLPSPYELSQLGRWDGAGKDDMWIGKLVLLGSRWDGVLRL